MSRCTVKLLFHKSYLKAIQANFHEDYDEFNYNIGRQSMRSYKARRTKRPCSAERVPLFRLTGISALEHKRHLLSTCREVVGEIQSSARTRARSRAYSRHRLNARA